MEVLHSSALSENMKQETTKHTVFLTKPIKKLQAECADVAFNPST